MSNMIIENPELITELMVKMKTFASVFTRMIQDRALAVEKTLDQLSNIKESCESKIKEIELKIDSLNNSSSEKEENQQEKAREIKELKSSLEEYKVQASYCDKFYQDLSSLNSPNSSIVGIEKELTEHLSKFPKGISSLEHIYQIMSIYLQFGPGSSPVLNSNYNNKTFGDSIGNFDRISLSNDYGDAKIYKLPDNGTMNSYYLNKFEAEAKQDGKNIFIQINQQDVSFMQNNNYNIVNDNNNLIAHKNFE